MQIQGYDIDEHAIKAAKANAERAGVADDITFGVKSVQDLWIDQQYGILISNPPYGMRMYDFRDINQIYISLNKTFKKENRLVNLYFDGRQEVPRLFQTCLARPQTQALQWPNIEVTYYQYYGERPPL